MMNDYLCLQVYDCVRELQALDVLLFKFVEILQGHAGIEQTFNHQCGYVAKALQET